MTNKQAVKWLKAYLQDTPFQMEQYEQAFEMAIKALSQDCVEPTHKHVENALDMRCDECRNKHTSICDKCENYDEYEQEPCKDAEQIDYHDDFATALKKINDYEQKSGKWIRVTDKTGHLVWECDKCSWQQRFNTNFCPDCGAKMESEDKE